MSFRVSGTSELVHVCCPARCVFARAAFSPRAVSREPVASLGPSSPRPVMTRPSGSRAQYCDSQELFLSKKCKKSRPQTVRPLGHASGVTGFCRGRSARKKETQTSGVRCEPWGRVVAAVRGKRLHESFRDREPAPRKGSRHRRRVGRVVLVHRVLSCGNPGRRGSVKKKKKKAPEAVGSVVFPAGSQALWSYLFRSGGAFVCAGPPLFPGTRHAPNDHRGYGKKWYIVISLKH